MARTTVTIVVKGTSHYRAPGLVASGALVRGVPVVLRHEPDNEHDPNAVGVRLAATNEKLGHIPKELAGKYAELLKRKQVRDAVVSDVSSDGNSPRITIRIVYEQPDSVLAERAESNLVQSASRLPSRPGVYSIKNIATKRRYIGASGDMRDRVAGHVTALFSGSHANAILQSDFADFGCDCFEAESLAFVSPSQLDSEEKRQIELHAASGQSLYNLTGDGQGNPASKWQRRLATKSITDRQDDVPPIPPLSRPTPHASESNFGPWAYLAAASLFGLLVLLAVRLISR